MEGVNWLRYTAYKKQNVILADEMGLGKTIQTIAYVSSRVEDCVWPHLVLAPLSTVRNWLREFSTWAPHLNVIVSILHYGWMRSKNK